MMSLFLKLLVNNENFHRRPALTHAIEATTKDWDYYKNSILNDFAMSGSISVGADAFNEIKGSGVEDGTSFRTIDKHSARLARLERSKQVISTSVSLCL